MSIFAPNGGNYSREGDYSREAINYFKYFSQEVVKKRNT